MDKLIIDQSLLSLNGWHFRNKDLPPSNPPEGAFAARTATGGRTPYIYHSSNNDIVDLNGASGEVISRGNGRATITVQDSDGQTASYTLEASNVQFLFGTGHFSTYTQCNNAAIEQGGTIPSLEQWRSYMNNYRGVEQPDEWCWSSTAGNTNQRWAINRKSGEEKQLRDFGFGGDSANGFGIRPAPTL